MKRPKDTQSPFPFVISLIKGKWRLEILEKLFEGPKRFTELERNIDGITPRMLVKELKELEEKNIIQRRAYMQLPPKVEYSVLPEALSLKEVIDTIRIWGEQHMENFSKNEVVTEVLNDEG